MKRFLSTLLLAATIPDPSRTVVSTGRLFYMDHRYHSFLSIGRRTFPGPFRSFDHGPGRRQADLSDRSPTSLAALVLLLFSEAGSRFPLFSWVSA